MALSPVQYAQELRFEMGLRGPIAAGLGKCLVL
jgi:hypothetical protein